MPRLPADMRISLKKRGGSTYRIELIRQPNGKRFWVRRDGVWSGVVPEATATEVAGFEQTSEVFRDFGSLFRQ